MFGLRLSILALISILAAAPALAANPPMPVPPAPPTAAPQAQQPPPPPTTDIAAAPAGTYVMDESHAGLNFRVNHLGFSLYHGRFNKFDAKINLDPTSEAKSSIGVSIDMASVDTHNTKLEGELRDWFKAAQFPTATFKSTKITRTGPTTYDVEGDFTMLGVTHPVRLAVTFQGYGQHPMSKKPTLGFSAAGTLKRSLWGILQGLPMVGDDVTFQFDAEFNKADGAAVPEPAPAPKPAK